MKNNLTVLQVSLNRAEGLIEECYPIIFTHHEHDVQFEGRWDTQNSVVRVKRTIDVEGDVLMHMYEWGQTAPAKGYDKIDFAVVFSNGFRYAGRFDSSQYGKEDGLTFFESLRHRMKYYANNEPPFYGIKKTREEARTKWEESGKILNSILDNW